MKVMWGFPIKKNISRSLISLEASQKGVGVTAIYTRFDSTNDFNESI